MVNAESHVKKTILPNGIRVITETLPYIRSVAIGLWLNTGSRDEPAEINGIAHFFEHMLFKGTKNRNARDIAMELERVGGGVKCFYGKRNGLLVCACS